MEARPTTSAVSHLTHLDWENVMTNVTRGRQVCSYRPRPPILYTGCRQLAAVQRTK